MDHPERVAKYVIETIHKGARAIFQTQQSTGKYDFDLTYAEGGKAAVEVTRSTLQQSQQTLAELKRRGCSVRAAACRQSWLVYPSPRARIQHVLKNVDRYLSAIEAEGLTKYHCELDRSSPAVSRILQDLQIVEGLTLTLPPPARIWLGGPCDSMTGSLVKADDLQRALEAEAIKSDNRRKLGASGCQERHLFVYIDPLNTHPWQALITGCIPERAPVLPAEITYAWVAAELDVNGIFVWTTAPRQGWQNRGLLTRPETYPMS
jgi:hypothetical protein